jgi:hypothetical protein
LKYRLHLEIDVLPESLNKKNTAGRWGRHKENKKWDMLIGLSIADQGESLPRSPLTKANVRFERKSHRFLDYDNFVASLKPVMDALVDAKVLLDDSWGVTGSWDCNQSFRPKANGPKLVIDIIEL